ncbi:hypothetical protein Tco_0194524 [Tanacetum coccineum]
MANLPPPNYVEDLPKDDPEEEPIKELKPVPKPEHLNGFALHPLPQQEGNMNGWIEEDDETDRGGTTAAAATDEDYEDDDITTPMDTQSAKPYGSPFDP